MILDTNAVSALFQGEQGLEKILQTSDKHHLPSIVIGEYRFGLLSSRKKKTLTKLLDRLKEESTILGCDAETAEHYAVIRHDLKKQGTPIPENDIWIAALANQHNLKIISRDTHFDYVKSVKNVGWQPQPKV